MNIQTTNGIIAAFTALVTAHPKAVAIGAGLLISWVFSAFVGGMPAPTAKSGGAYLWSYKSLHLLAGNLDRFVAKIEGKTEEHHDEEHHNGN
jgi:hypothetical protein